MGEIGGCTVKFPRTEVFAEGSSKSRIQLSWQFEASHFHPHQRIVTPSLVKELEKYGMPKGTLIASEHYLESLDYYRKKGFPETKTRKTDALTERNVFFMKVEK